MTAKQIYTELAKIAGFRCSDTQPFLCTKKTLQADLKHVQSHLRALMEKVSYERTWHDFGRMAVQSRPRRRITYLTPTLEDMSLDPLQGQPFDHAMISPRMGEGEPAISPDPEENEDE